MTVRCATTDDIPRLMELARAEHMDSRFKHEQFDSVVSARNFESAIRGMLTCVFISEKQGGFIAGMVQPCLHNKFMRAYELCWYAQDGSGLQLLDALTKWAKKMRALEVVVSNYAGMVPADKFTAVMKRKGFPILGTSYSKNLET